MRDNGAAWVKIAHEKNMSESIVRCSYAKRKRLGLKANVKIIEHLHHRDQGFEAQKRPCKLSHKSNSQFEKFSMKKIEYGKFHL